MTSYQELLDEAMLGIVKKVLSRVQDEGLENDQSFYISFRTDHPDVHISRHVRSKYPKEITVVLQYQFRDLVVYDDKFAVNIAFGGVPENVEVPFDSLTSFVDPVENFSLQFRRVFSIEDLEEHLEELEELEGHVFQDIPAPAKKIQKKQKAGEVIALDKYRRKKKQ